MPVMSYCISMLGRIVDWCISLSTGCTEYMRSIENNQQSISCLGISGVYKTIDLYYARSNEDMQLPIIRSFTVIRFAG